MDRSRFIAVFSSTPPQILEFAHSFTSRVEVHDCGAVVLAIAPQYEQPAFEQLLEMTASVGRLDFGAGPSRSIALFAARAHPGTTVQKGAEDNFLDSLPVTLLQLQFDTKALQPHLEILEGWGIHTLGQLARLPSPQLAGRLGNLGIQMQRVARGEDLEPLPASPSEPVFQEKEDWDWELKNFEPLSFLLLRLLESLCQKLRTHGLAADKLSIELRLSDGTISRQSVELAFPMRQPKVLLSILRLKLQSEPLESGVTGVTLVAHPERPRAFQYSLLARGQTDPEKLSRALSRLGTVVGEERLGSPRVLDSHFPDAFQLVPVDQFPLASRKKTQNGTGSKPARTPNAKLILRRVRPPTPTRIATHQIVTCSGPWRSSGNWWVKPGDGPKPSIDAWDRDEWDVELTDGTICRIFWDRRKHAWYLEGIYD